jgi:DNA recombination protein RmuC
VTDVVIWVVLGLSLLCAGLLLWGRNRQDGNDGLERALRQEMQETARAARQELAQNLATFQQALLQQGAEATRTQNAQIDAFGQQLSLLQKSLSDTLTLQLGALSESNARRLAEVRQTLEAQLVQLQTTNATKLEEMRATVDEKLQSTLQARLGESFKQVADRLEQVHKGLGEMQTLAQGVGDLKHLLTNVKNRKACLNRCLCQTSMPCK